MKKLEVKRLKRQHFRSYRKRMDADYSRNKGEVQHYNSKLGWHWLALE